MDTTPPTFASAATNAAGTQITVNLTETESLPILPPTGASGFEVRVNGSYRGITAAERATDTSILITLSSPVVFGDLVKLNYGGGNVTDSAGNHLPTTTNAPVSNHVPPAAIDLRYYADHGAAITAEVIDPAAGASLGTVTLTESTLRLGYYAGALPEAATMRPLDVIYRDGETVLQIVTLPVVATGTGARTVTLTVTDGTDPIASALVRLTAGAVSYSAQTNASGIATFNVDDATWTISITKAGYAYSGSLLNVSGHIAATLAMTALNPPAAAAPDQVTAYLYTRDQSGVVQAAQTVSYRLVKPPVAGNGAYDDAIKTATSDSNGLWSVAMLKGGTYTYWRNDGPSRTVKIPTTATSPYALPEVYG